MSASFIKLSIIAPTILITFGRRVLATMKSGETTGTFKAKTEASGTIKAKTEAPGISKGKIDEATTKRAQSMKNSRKKRVRRLSLILYTSIYGYIPYGILALCVPIVNENYQGNHSVLLFTKILQDSYFILINIFIALFPRKSE